MLTGYGLRAEALEAERAWINDRLSAGALVTADDRRAAAQRRRLEERIRPTLDALQADRIDWRRLADEERAAAPDSTVG